jgi:hypothetical protein
MAGDVNTASVHAGRRQRPPRTLRAPPGRATASRPVLAARVVSVMMALVGSWGVA